MRHPPGNKNFKKVWNKITGRDADGSVHEVWFEDVRVPAENLVGQLNGSFGQLMKQLEHGKGYRYAHDEEGGFAAGENYLPEGMPEPGFYVPVERGLEIKIAHKLRELRARNASADSAGIASEES